MTVSRDEAQEALSVIKDAGGRARRFSNYSEASPGLILWGLVWLCADLATQFAPQWRSAWTIADLIGVGGSMVISVVLGRRQSGEFSYRRGLTFFSGILFVFALFAIMWPITFRQSHAFWGLFIGWLYVVNGVWVGPRFVVLGILLASLSVAAYFWVTSYYPLFMGVVGGGGLILAGFWLRKV